MKKTHIGIIGVGKLGLCFALNLEASGYQVTGLDVDPDYTATLNARKLESHEPVVSEMLARCQDFEASTDWQAIMAEDIDLIFIVVATPSLPEGGYDHGQVDAVLARLSAFGAPKRRRDLVVMCTTMPGYCDQAAARMAAFNYSLSYNPEFIAQGRIIQDQQYPDQVLIGEADAQAGARIEALYRKLCRNAPTFHRMSRISAEITKLATNCFITTKISFANSIGALAETVGAEPDKVLHAIGSDSRIGTKYLGYGFGYGGPCFPRDNRALAKFGQDNGMEMHLGQATDRVNQQHLQFMFRQWMQAHAPEATIEFKQVTYKPGTVILEESQQLALAVLLARAGRKVRVCEHPEVIRQLRELYGDLFEYALRE